MTRLLLTTIGCFLITLAAIQAQPWGSPSAVARVRPRLAPAADPPRPVPAPVVLRVPESPSSLGSSAGSAPVVVARVDAFQTDPAPPALEDLTGEPVLDVEGLPGAARAIGRLCERLEARLSEQLESDGATVGSLARSAHLAGLDPSRLSDLDLDELYRRHSELQRELYEDLRAERVPLESLLDGGAPTAPGWRVSRERYDAFSQAGVALACSYRR